MFTGSRNARCKVARAMVLACLLGGCVGARAQVTLLGDSLKMEMDGRIGYGFNGSFGDVGPSSRNTTGFTGQGVLKGHYYHPNFLNFQFRPYYEYNRANSESQSITVGSGFGGSVSLFGGTRFPGTISFAKGIANNDEYRMAGISALTSASTTRNFSVSWGMLLPDLPKVTASYSLASSHSDFMDLDSGNASSRNLNVNATYDWWGFDLQGLYSRNQNSFDFPAFLNIGRMSTDNTSNSLGVTARHDLPMRGNLSLGWNYWQVDNGPDAEYSAKSYQAAVSFSPWSRLTIYQNVTYQMDLASALAQTIPGGPLDGGGLLDDGESNGIFYTAGSTLTLGHGLTANGRVNHRRQTLHGRTHEDTQYGGTLSYNRNARILGLLYLGVGVIDTASQRGNDSLGFNGVVGVSRKLWGWDTAGDFNYSQNVQTLLSVSTTSTYNYGGSAQRKFTRELRWGATFRGSHTGLVKQEGSGNRSESYGTQLGWRKHHFASTYSRSSGTAVFSSSGELTPTPDAPFLTDNFVLFNARSLSVSASTTMFRRLLLTGGYSRYNSDRLRVDDNTLSKGNRVTMRSEYRLRKFSILAGYTRSNQDVSTFTDGPHVVNSYYVSLSRWISLF